MPAWRALRINDIAIKVLGTAQELAWIQVLPMPVLTLNPKTMKVTWEGRSDQVYSLPLARHLLVSAVLLQ